MTNKLKLRPATADDIAGIERLCQAERMPTPPKIAEITVATDQAEQILGFIRILPVTDDVKPLGNGEYIYPVVVQADLRKQHIAESLVRYALNNSSSGQLKCVACKPSQEFYPKAGFVTAEWECIADQIAIDCERCPDLNSCEPKPFIIKR